MKERKSYDMKEHKSYDTEDPPTYSTSVLFMIIFMMIEYHCYRAVLEQTPNNSSARSADMLIKVKKFSLIT